MTRNCGRCGRFCCTSPSDLATLGLNVCPACCTDDDWHQLHERDYLRAEEKVQVLRLTASGGLRPNGCPGRKLAAALAERDHALALFVGHPLPEIEEQRTLEWARALPIDADIPEDLTEEEVRETGFRRWVATIQGSDDTIALGLGDFDESTVRRWARNYIRHELTPYDNLIEDATEGQYQVIRARVNTAISSRFPGLAKAG